MSVLANDPVPKHRLQRGIFPTTTPSPSLPTGSYHRTPVRFGRPLQAAYYNTIRKKRTSFVFLFLFFPSDQNAL